MTPVKDPTSVSGMLDGIRVVEIADEQAEYVGLVLAGLGADVIKVEPMDGSPTRRIGPFYKDVVDPEGSLFFWQYNRGKRSIRLDLDGETDQAILWSLIERADVLIESAPHGWLKERGFGVDTLRERTPRLVIGRVSPFGDDGPWQAYKASDLVHLALGGQVMNCGYDPRPDGTYDLPPIAPQMWQAYHVAGENLLMSILAALYYRHRGGEGQYLSCAVHEAVAKNTEIDLMSWVMRHAPVHRMTCRHAGEGVSLVPSIQQTKDGRWYMVQPSGRTGGSALTEFLSGYGMAGDLADLPEDTVPVGRTIPGTSAVDEVAAHTFEVIQRMVRKFTYADFPWWQAQQAGVMCTPLRRPEENVSDQHWHARGTFAQVHHPEHDRDFVYAIRKWVSNETDWKAGRRAPSLDEDRAAILAELAAEPAMPVRAQISMPAVSALSPRGAPWALEGVRILDFGWFLASAGGTRFLTGMGAECLKVEWAAHPDTRIGAMAPVGGREARRRAKGPLAGVVDPDMGGQFNNKNAGKLGISLNVRHPEGLDIAKRLASLSDIVSEGFSPGVLDRWGLGYDVLRTLRPDIIYAQQSGMGSQGTYGRFRAIGPIAAALSGLSEMSGLPEPAMPAGWGYSYLDWVGAYSFAISMLSALNYRAATGRGQYIDASQTESGIFLCGTALLDWSAHGRRWHRYGNRSPFKPAAPHGIYPCRGVDRWIAIACFDDAEWAAVAEASGHREWLSDQRFRTLAGRLSHQDDLDAELAMWTVKVDCYDLMYGLQSRGVAAGVCQNAEDRVETDPQLAALTWLTELHGTKIGDWPVAELSVKMSETPPYIGGITNRGAPVYGEDNERVYGDLLGFTTAEIGRLRRDGVI